MPIRYVNCSREPYSPHLEAMNYNFRMTMPWQLFLERTIKEISITSPICMHFKLIISLKETEVLCQPSGIRLMLHQKLQSAIMSLRQWMKFTSWAVLSYESNISEEIGNQIIRKKKIVSLHTQLKECGALKSPSPLWKH